VQARAALVVVCAPSSKFWRESRCCLFSGDDDDDEMWELLRLAELQHQQKKQTR
jgi:hypothetical protein